MSRRRDGRLSQQAGAPRGTARHDRPMDAGEEGVARALGICRTPRTALSTRLILYDEVMKLLFIVLALMLLTACAETPIREGYATTYESTDDSSPGIVYEATTRPGISLSDLNDPKKMKTYMDANMKPALPFYIKVYKDYILA